MKKLTEIMYEVRLDEAGLSRIWRHIKNYDVAMISGFRGKNDSCAVPQTDKPVGEEYTIGENKKRNKILKAKLLSKGFGVTPVDGSYVEQYGDGSMNETSENSFFVVNLKNDPKFISDVLRLGKEFCQDSVLIHPKGVENFYFVGTNHSDFPGYGKKFAAGTKVVYGAVHQFMSKTKGRPFAIVNPDDPESNPKFESMLQTYENQSMNSKRIIKELARKSVCDAKKM